LTNPNVGSVQINTEVYMINNAYSPYFILIISKEGRSYILPYYKVVRIYII